MYAIRLLALTLIVLLPACSRAQGVPARDVQELASALTKVASAVESTVHVKKQAAALQDMDLLRKATEHDPDLLTPFRPFVLRAEQNGDHAIIVVCRNGEIMLMDATCTRRADQPPPELKPGSSCLIPPPLVSKLCPSTP